MTLFEDIRPVKGCLKNTVSIINYRSLPDFPELVRMMRLTPEKNANTPFIKTNYFAALKGYFDKIQRSLNKTCD
jgi:hypothetical protein